MLHSCWFVMSENVYKPEKNNLWNCVLKCDRKCAMLANMKVEMVYSVTDGRGYSITLVATELL